MGVTTQQYQALLALKAHEADEPSISDLAHELLLQHNNAVQLVDRLVAAELVTREPAARGRRFVALHLTPKGERTLGALASANLGNLRSRRSEWAHLSRLLGAIGRNNKRK